MDSNPFSYIEQPATLADVQAIEKKYAFVLPTDYKNHILAYNGGRPVRRTFLQLETDGQTIERKFRSLYPIKNGPDTMEDALQSLRDQLHADLVPFGEESGGDQFVLSVGPEDYGSVYYISHEFYKPPKRNEMKQSRQYGKGVSFLAPSFTAFLNGLVAGTPA